MMREMGFEPMRMTPLVPETSALTTWLSTLMATNSFLLFYDSIDSFALLIQPT